LWLAGEKKGPARKNNAQLTEEVKEGHELAENSAG
jgi:hypothetical protein